MFERCFKIQVEEKEMREVFAEVMEELAQADPRVIYLDCDIKIGRASCRERV